jgi:2-oxoglutarate ferredoxin oxidoreductase subunit gamma
MITRFVFSGTGGQGIITAAIVLAEAAIHYEGLEAVQTQSYGAEARGGAARADVIIATDPIKFPKVMQPNILVCLSQVSFDKYAWIVRPGGFVLIDPHYAHRRSDLNSRCIEIPFHQSIMDAQHTLLNLNLCMLGALTGLIDFVSTESLAEAVRDRFQRRGAEPALQAVWIGRSLVRESVEVF